MQERMHFLWSASSLFMLLMEYAYRDVCVYICFYVYLYLWPEWGGVRFLVAWESGGKAPTGCYKRGSFWRQPLWGISCLSFSFIHVTVDGFYPSFSIPYIRYSSAICLYGVVAVWYYGAPAGLDCWALHSLVVSYVGQEEAVTSACKLIANLGSRLYKQTH